VFVDLTAAYDTVWHRGFTCKLLRLLPDIHMVFMTMQMVGNRSFTLTTSNGKRAGYDALRTAFTRVLSWHHFSSTSASVTCQPPPPCKLMETGKQWKVCWAVFLLRKLYTEQMFVMLRTKRMQLQPCRHANSEAFPMLKGLCDICIYRIKFRLLIVRENEIAPRELSGGTTQLRSCAPLREHWCWAKTWQP